MLFRSINNENSLKEINQLFESTFSQAAVGIAHVSPNGEFKRINQKFCDITGYSMDEMQTLTFQKITHPEDLEIDMQYVKALLNGEMRTYTLEKRYIRKDNSIIWINLTVSLVRDENNSPKFFISVIEDINAKKIAEEQLKISNELLKRSNRDLEQFAYVASHDLQEPLRIIANFTQLFEKKFTSKIDAEADEFIHFIIDSTKRMQDLINDLLSYSRISSQKRKYSEIDLNETIEKILFDLDALIKENNVLIEYEKFPFIFGEKTQIYQLFLNLISNAIKFHSEKQPQIKIACQSNKNEHQISVEDNGIGIDPEFFDRIFIIFQRLHGKNIPGTGKGLAISKKIVEQHGGKIWVESKVGKGAKFIFTIPNKL